MVTVGIDPHKHVHVAVAVGNDGRQAGKSLTAKTDALLIITLLKWSGRSPTAPPPGPLKTAAGSRVSLLTVCCSPARRWSGCRPA